ncbi:MAG: cytochrome P450 [bacterium]|nr:cytochrome P450 [bacterium]
MPHLPAPTLLDDTDPTFWQDAHTPLREARERHPLARLQAIAAWAVLRHADVERLFTDPRLRTAYTGFNEGALERVLGGFLAAREGADHSRLRALVMRAFTPRRIELARPFVRAAARRLIDALPAGRPVDFQAAVADPLGAHVIARILGVPEGDEAVFGAWTGGLMAGMSPLADAGVRAAAEADAVALRAYLGDLAARRRSRPGDDLLDALVAAEADGHRLSPEELRDVVMSLMLGGHETVRSVLTVTTWLALAHAGTLERLHREPERIPGAVEEVLRYEPPLLGAPRVTTEGLEIGGVAIPAGARVFLEIAAANRDPRRFTDPDRFDVGRDATHHLGFGRGPHFCVGAALARTEAQELLAVLCEDPTALALVEPPRWQAFSPARRLETLRVQRSVSGR